MRELFTIGEAADAVGLTRTTLRHYDDIGLAVPTTRRGGQRRYAARDLHRLRVITDLRRGGFRLDEIRQLLDGDDWQPLARRKRRELGERLEELVAAAELVDAALACGCADLEGCASEEVGAQPGSRHARPGLTDPTRRLPEPAGGH